jgi:uncharacterized protein
MPDQLTATAVVFTEAPARYAKQLASHLGRRAEVREETDGTRIVLGDASCLLQSRPGSLELSATADNSEALERVMDVVGRHLERFGQRNELHVDWTRS